MHFHKKIKYRISYLQLWLRYIIGWERSVDINSLLVNPLWLQAVTFEGQTLKDGMVKLA